MPETKRETVLQVRDLRTYFHGNGQVVKAVDGVSFDLRKGEALGIVGESGSGKSVTAYSLMGLVDAPGRIESGQAIYGYDGMRVDLLELDESDLRAYRGAHVSLIFQEPMSSLNPVMRCGWQVAEAIRIHEKISKAEAKKRVLELFEEVQLPEPERIFRAYPHQLSGGQIQRVMIAMALSCRPSIVIADEPTTALDVTVQKRIIELLNHLRRKHGMSILFISHDLGVISEVADRVLVMYNGQVVEMAAVSEIFDRPQHPYTKSLIACRPPLDRRLHRLPTVSDFMMIKTSSEGVPHIVEREDVPTWTAVTNEEIEKRKTHLSKQPSLLDVTDLRVWYPTKTNFLGRALAYTKAVDGVSFRVRHGETVGLVGESGCGKSTLGRTIVRLIPPVSGHVVFGDQDVFALSGKALKAFRKDVQIIFQDPYSALNPRLKIGDAIKEPLDIHGLYKRGKQRKERTIELLELVGLQADHYDRYPHQFSGGQRQRICIARSLALDPKLLICDESVSALDVSVQSQVLNLLMDLRARFHLSMIFISHDLSVVRFMSDRILVMRDGIIEEAGDADAIYNQPQSTYTRGLIDAIPGVRVNLS